MSYAEKHVKGNNRKITWINSIRFRMTLIILLASSLVVGVSGFLAYRYFDQVKADELSTLAQVTANRLSQHLVTPMWDVNYEQVGSLLEAEMGESKIVKIVVVDEDGKSIFAAKERTPSGIVNATSLFGGNDTFAGKRPIFNGEKKVGDINVFISKSKVYDELATIAKLIALVGLILGLALTIVTSFALSTLVVKPLRKLTDNAEQISKGDFKQQIDLSRQDEIGYLGATIDRMQYGLRVAAMRLRQN
ncbi:MAG: HAMP domain-containing protein, partial [Acidiferrobacterales bacterium]|nr:HAMP domain-containing protein [Acidiferrobacterales bacterium]